MDFKVTFSANARELANALIVLDRHMNEIKTDIPVLDQLNGSITESGPAPVKKTEPVKKTKKAADGAQEATATESTTGADATVETAERIDLETIREVVQAKSRAGHKTAIIALLKDYKVKTVPDLSQEQFPEFYQKVCAL